MDADELSTALAGFQAEYRSSLPQRLSAIDDAWSSIERGDADPAQLDTLVRGLHSIAGSALTFGMAELGDAAAAAERWLEPYRDRRQAPAAAARAAFEPLLVAVRDAAR